MLKVSSDSLDFALEHVEHYGDTDILPSAFEFRAIRWSWDEVRSFLAGQDLHTWQVGPTRICLSPKGRLGYRLVTQLDPIDTLLFTALVYEVGREIEAVRVSRQEHIVHSYRFEPDDRGGLYSREFSYETFRRQSLYLAKKNIHGWVILTDISDFFLRIYLHRLDNALRQAIPVEHARAIYRLIKQWNQNVSYSIPVGPAPSLLLAELAIVDIDNALYNRGIVYCRYSDDFRLFASTKAQALQELSVLANTLYANHGLTLQESKTELMTSLEFLEHFRETEDQRTRQNLETNFEEIIETQGIDTYGAIDYDDLEPYEQHIVERTNLAEIVSDQVRRDGPINVPLTRFVLRRLVQLGEVSIDLVDLLINEIDKVLPVFREVISVLKIAPLCTSSDYHKFKRQVLNLLDHPVLAHLVYYRIWLLTLFQDSTMAQVNLSPTLYELDSDPLSRREAMVVMAFIDNQGWIRTKKMHLFDLSPWERRAYLWASRCLPEDEAKHWLIAIKPRLKALEKWVLAWAHANSARR